MLATAIRILILDQFLSLHKIWPREYNVTLKPFSKLGGLVMEIKVSRVMRFLQLIKLCAPHCLWRGVKEREEKQIEKDKEK